MYKPAFICSRAAFYLALSLLKIIKGEFFSISTVWDEGKREGWEAFAIVSKGCQWIGGRFAVLVQRGIFAWRGWAANLDGFIGDCWFSWVMSERLLAVGVWWLLWRRSVVMYGASWRNRQTSSIYNSVDCFCRYHCEYELPCNIVSLLLVNCRSDFSGWKDPCLKWWSCVLGDSWRAVLGKGEAHAGWCTGRRGEGSWSEAKWGCCVVWVEWGWCKEPWTEIASDNLSQAECFRVATREMMRFVAILRIACWQHLVVPQLYKYKNSFDMYCILLTRYSVYLPLYDGQRCCIVQKHNRINAASRVHSSPYCTVPSSPSPSPSKGNMHIRSMLSIYSHTIKFSKIDSSASALFYVHFAAVSEPVDTMSC